jgi:hypothetical protein
VIKERPGWVNWPVIVAVIAFIVGAAVAGVIVAFVYARNDDGDGSPDGGSATAVSTVTVTSTPVVTPTPGDPRDPDDALATFVATELDETYLGPCPQEASTAVPEGLCSVELYRSDEQVAFGLGPPFSEGTGEALLLVGENGVWEVTFIPITGNPPVAGEDATVIGAGDCLTFRAGPGTSQQPLSCQLDGTSGEVVGGPEAVDDITWWQLRDLGWASSEFLQHAP